MAQLLGIDIGTSSCKAIVIDETGRVLAEAVEKYPISRPHPTWSEQDPEDWWKGARAAMWAVGCRLSAVSDQRQTAHSKHPTPIAPSAIGLTGQMHGAVFLDKNDCVIRPAILWNDQRTAEECVDIERIVGAQRVREITGNPPLTGFQLPKILWLRKHEPENFARLRKVLLPKDYIRFLLTGKFFTEVSDASGTGIFDVRRRDWSGEMMSMLDLDPSLFPECVESIVQTGEALSVECLALRVDKDTSGGDAMGSANSPQRTANIPVFGGGGDQAAGAVGTGAVSPGVISISLGTSGVVFQSIDEISLDGSEISRATGIPDKPERAKSGRDSRSAINDAVHLFCHANGRWHQMGVMLSCGGALSWYADCVRHMPVEDVLTEASSSVAGCGGLTFLPYLTGERSPHNDPFARGGFVGLDLSHTSADMSRAVVEGITFGLLDCYRAMQGPPPLVGEVSRSDGGGDHEKGRHHVRAPIPAPPDLPPTGEDLAPSLRVTGGGARSNIWVQMIADVFGMPCEVLEADQGPAFGAALIAGVGVGVWPTMQEACAQCIRIKERIEPSDTNYEEAYSRYRSLYPALKDWFRSD